MTSIRRMRNENPRARSTDGPLVDALLHRIPSAAYNYPPDPSTMDSDDYSYYDSYLAGEQNIPLSGNPLGIRTRNLLNPYGDLSSTSTQEPLSLFVANHQIRPSRRAITVLVEKLKKKGIVKDDEGPWGSHIVLASKPSQGHVHWSQFVFQLYVSY
jgi:hypothetical protein